MTKKAKKKKKRLTANELKALGLKAQHPEWSDHAIGKEMVRLGYVVDDNYLNHRVSRSKEVRDKIAILQEKGQLNFTRLIPKAAKKLKSYLELDETPLKAIDIAAKYGLGRQEDSPVRQSTINIETLQQIQHINLIGCQEKLDAIEVQESDKGSNNE